MPEKDDENEFHLGQEKGFEQGIKEKWNQAREKITGSYENLEESEKVGFISALSYVPFIGWLIPYIMQRRRSCAFHIEQSIRLNLVFIAVMLFCWLLKNIPVLSNLLDAIQFHNVTNFIQYITVWAFAVFSGLAAWKATQGKEWKIPFIELINLDLLGKKNEKTDQN